MSSSYLNRAYLKDFKTGELLSTTVMYDGTKRIFGTGNVLEYLRGNLLKKAIELGGRDLTTRHFIDAFSIRGPDYGDVVRKTIDLYVAGGKMRKRKVGSSYRYDVI
ncbi:MAG: hypothetical protein ABSA75_13155 [Candidatus Bathyarchaeia archaeon]|jgi:hypothetical protein